MSIDVKGKVTTPRKLMGSGYMDPRILDLGTSWK
jgi:hypothetical protein